MHSVLECRIETDHLVDIGQELIQPLWRRRIEVTLQQRKDDDLIIGVPWRVWRRVKNRMVLSAFSDLDLHLHRALQHHANRIHAYLDHIGRTQVVYVPASRRHCLQHVDKSLESEIPYRHRHTCPPARSLAPRLVKSAMTCSLVSLRLRSTYRWPRI